MKLVAAGLAGARHLNGTGAAIFRRKSVDLNGGFLDRIGIRCEIQHALPNTAIDIESIHNELITHGSLAVRAYIDGGFGRVVVNSGTGRSTAAGCPSTHRSQARDSWRQCDQRNKT